MSNFASNDNMTALFTATGEKIGERAKIFPGTKAEWDALPLSEKIKYDYVAFAGDSQSGIVDDVPTEDSEHLVKSGGVYDSLATKANLTQISNPNLLDNPWFTINQRGQSSYTNGMSLDRWHYFTNNSGDLSISNNGIVFPLKSNSQTNLFQRLDSEVLNLLRGKTVTFSIMINDTIYSGTATIPTGSETFNFSYRTTTRNNVNVDFFYQQDGYLTFRVIKWGSEAITDNSITIRAVKLELGSVSTLAMDTAPNYATELLKCQRYFYRLKSTGGNDWIAFGKAWTSSAVNVIIPIPSMRALPTASVSDMTKLLVAKGSSTLDPHRISQILAGYYKEFGSSIAMTLTLADSTATNGDNYVLKADAPVNIDFSADL